eukprot:PhF_6_TR3733/c0_g1_i1/m.5359
MSQTTLFIDLQSPLRIPRRQHRLSMFPSRLVVGGSSNNNNQYPHEGPQPCRRGQSTTRDHRALAACASRRSKTTRLHGSWGVTTRSTWTVSPLCVRSNKRTHLSNKPSITTTQRYLVCDVRYVGIILVNSIFQTVRWRRLKPHS